MVIIRSSNRFFYSFQFFQCQNSRILQILESESTSIHNIVICLLNKVEITLQSLISARFAKSQKSIRNTIDRIRYCSMFTHFVHYLSLVFSFNERILNNTSRTCCNLASFRQTTSAARQLFNLNYYNYKLALLSLNYVF